MAGYNAILELRRLEKAVDELGFMMSSPRTGNWGDDGDRVSLKPKDADSVPIYNRDAEVFTGTLEQLQTWIRGVEWARSYDMMLKLSDEKKRAAKEDQERARQFSAKQRQLLDELKKDHCNEQAK
jgi:hypothetical protein